MRTQRCSCNLCRGSSNFRLENKAGLSPRSDREGLVNPIRPKQPRVRLDPESYERLRQRVLRRDGWRCQVCGPDKTAGHHHKQLPSQQGLDDDSNLITLYASCHEGLHRSRQKTEPQE
jgi:hypothetical protein